MRGNTQRRDKHEADRLQKLAARNPEQCRHEWERKLQALAMEPVVRGISAT